jgi:hypothetical protein
MTSNLSHLRRHCFIPAAASLLQAPLQQTPKKAGIWRAVRDGGKAAA